MRIVATFAIFISFNLMADKSDELFKNNQESISYIQSFKMDCSSYSPLCNERDEALYSEEQFNDIFEKALSKNIHLWPNNEVLNIEKALNLRRKADESFSASFFGNASEGYQDAAKIILDTLKLADDTVNELIDIGEEYLYEGEKPEWAAPYFNEAAPYDPENQRIINGLSRIRFLRDFEGEVKNIEELMLSNKFEEALSLITKAELRDPGNKVLIQLREKAYQGKEFIEIQGVINELNTNDYSLSLYEKKEKLIKIENAIYLYGLERLGLDIKTSRIYLIDTILLEEFRRLKDEFIKNPNEIEKVYKDALMLNTNYPDNKEVEEFLKKITKIRNPSKLIELRALVEKELSSEDWLAAKIILEEINLLSNTVATEEKIREVSKIIELLSMVEGIVDNSEYFLKDKNGLDSAATVYENLIIFSNESTPKLMNTLKEFNDLIVENKNLLSESSQNRKKKEVSSKNKQTQVSKDVSTKNINKPNAIPSGYFRKASLDMSSFSSSVICTKRIRNKKFVAEFNIIISSIGTPVSINLINSEEINIDSNIRKALEVVTNALKKSKYIPAKNDGIYVESTLTKRLSIPKGFCS